MWNHLPLGQLHQTINYGCAGGVCTGRYANVYHAQAKQQLKRIEADLIALHHDDPTMYYQGDYDTLLDQHQAMTNRLREPFA